MSDDFFSDITESKSTEVQNNFLLGGKRSRKRRAEEESEDEEDVKDEKTKPRIIVSKSLAIDTTSFAKGHRQSPTCVALSVDSRTAASSSKDGSILICTDSCIFFARIFV